MIKYFFLSFILISLLFPIKIENIRELYKNSNSSKQNAEKLYKELEKITKSDSSTLIGYKGASIILKSKYIKGVKNKKQLFKKGKNILEAQIIENPKNIELRLIRLSIQENAPKILKYKDNIVEDKTFIKHNLNAVKDKKLKKYIEDFILKSKSFLKEN